MGGQGAPVPRIHCKASLALLVHGAMLIHAHTPVNDILSLDIDKSTHASFKHASRPLQLPRKLAIPANRFYWQFKGHATAPTSHARFRTPTGSSKASERTAEEAGHSKTICEPLLLAIQRPLLESTTAVHVPYILQPISLVFFSFGPDTTSNAGRSSKCNRSGT
jgi:hypothetical protein